MTKFMNLSALEIVGLTIIGEARGEPIEGQVAVACVIRNRRQNRTDKYRKYHDVCLEPKQFSCWNEDDANFPMLTDLADKLLNGQPIQDIYLRQCMFVARGVIEWDILDNTKGALNYMARWLYESDKKPDWAKFPRRDPLYIGRQVFIHL